MAPTLPAKAMTPATTSLAPALAAKPAAVTLPAVIPALKTAPPVAAPVVKPAQAVIAPVMKPAAPVVASAVNAAKSAGTVPAKPVSALPIPPAAATPKVAAAPASSAVRLTFGEETWAEVRDAKGNVISSQINPAGSELNLKGQGPFSLVVGHASTSRLFHKGKQIDLVPHASANSDVARLTLE
jgi:cytoskeleton protein RodZ